MAIGSNPLSSHQVVRTSWHEFIRHRIAGYGGRAPTRRRREQKRAGKLVPGAFARWLFDENPPQDRFRRVPHRVHPDRGEASDSPQFATLLDIGPEITPRAALADKGYDSKANRAAARKRGRVCPAILIDQTETRYRISI
jgi:hypothetical protein